jgi:hypothetical protein
MTDDNPPIRSLHITSRSGLASYLTGLRQKAGLSYRQIRDAAAEFKANGGWIELPVTTVSDFLHGKRLPTEAQLRTFLRVCQVRPDEAVQLLATRQRLADHEAAEPRIRREQPAPAGTTTVSSGLGQPISEKLDPFALEVHEAIKVPGIDAPPALPPYLEREHDHQIRERIARAVAEERSTMVVLVGGSSTGKTRACWEAIHAEAAGEKLLAGWRLWHPYDPTRPGAALDALDRVGPRTVVWLNESQLYLLTEGSGAGERVAARLRTLLAEADRAPVLVLGTMWPEYWHTLTRVPDAREPDIHEQARKLLAGTHIAIAESFDEALVNKLKTSVEMDPRLVAAATHAEDRELTQYLAGAPALLERYEAAPLAAKALLTAAMDLRRLGHGAALPLGLLEAIAPTYLTDRQWESLSDDWFSSALSYTEQRCHGAHRPLTRIRARHAQPASSPSHYRLADYLEQTGRQRRRRAIVPTMLWQELAAHVKYPEDAGRLARAAADRLLYGYAIPFLRRAADGGDGSAAAYRLADLLAERGDLEGAITLLRARADAGNEYAA